MKYLIHCECGEDVEVAKSQAGQSVQCSCGQELQVPTLRGLMQLPVAESDSGKQSDQVREDVNRQQWGAWRGPTMAIATAVCILSLITAAYYSYNYSIVKTDYTVEDAVQASRESFKNVGVLELDYIWHNYETSSVRGQSFPMFVLRQQYALVLKNWIIGSGILAAVTGSTAIALALTARKSTARR